MLNTAKAELRAFPRRTCVGCRGRFSQTQLVRFTLDDLGQLVWRRAAPGRGAWLCREGACWDLATKRNAWSRAWRRPVSVVGPPPEPITGRGFRSRSESD